MPDTAKYLFSVTVPPILPLALVAWLIEIDGPTANNIAIAIVWAYFEVQRRNDARKMAAIAEAKAKPVALATMRLEAKVDANTRNLILKEASDGQETRQAEADAPDEAHQGR